MNNILPFNTGLEMWQNMAELKPTVTFIVRAGHVYDQSECIARFRNNSEAGDILTEAGVKHEFPKQLRYRIVHYPGLATHINVEYDTGFTYTAETRLSLGNSRDLIRDAVKRINGACEFETPERDVLLSPWVDLKED